MARHYFDDLPDPERIQVRSKTYGTHTRARRGSKSKAEVNDTLKKHTVLLTTANVPAQLVKEAVDQHRSGFPSGQLWQSLVGMFKTQLKNHLPLNVNDLCFKDINTDYRFSRLARNGCNKTISSGPAGISVQINEFMPSFRARTINGFIAEAVALYFDFSHMQSTSDQAVSAVLPAGKQNTLSLDLKTGKPGNQYLIILKLSGCIDDTILTDPPARGMVIIDAGTVTETGLQSSPHPIPHT